VIVSRTILQVVGAVVALVACAAVVSAQQVEDYSSTVAEFSKSPVVARYFDSAYGYALFPTIGKGGFLVGGAYGKGQVYRQGEVVGFSSLTEVSVGFQFGGQAYSQVVFFQDARALEEFTSGNFEFSAEASAIAVTASAGVEGGTEGATAGAGLYGVDAANADIDFHDGMLVFTLAKGGLMYQATIAGQKYGYEARH
jgi:lipid-binding SYLF domain-containing protein